MRILAIGTRSNIQKKIFTGQSVMFDGVIAELEKLDHDVVVVDISRRGSQNTISRVFDYLIVLLKEFWYLLTQKFDVGYITTAQSKKGFFRDYLIIGLFHTFGVKIIMHQYGANYNQLINSLGKQGLKNLTKILNTASRIIVEGEHMRSQFSFIENYKKKVKIIPNGLPIIGENALKNKTYDRSQPFKIFYLSNLIWSKGYYEVLEAVNLLVNKYHRNIKCVFAGAFMASVDDPTPGISNKSDFERFISENNLEDVIEYYPGLYGKEKDRIFYSSNVFVLPTYYINEGQPVSIIEAMAYGCVPIVTEYRHIPMMVNKENGCFVEPKRPDQIAFAIMQLMDNPNEYYRKSQLCIRDYQNNFTFEKFADKVLDCMQSEINNA